MMLLVGVLVGVAVCAVAWVLVGGLVWHKNAPPQVHLGLPVLGLGNALAFARGPLNFISRAYHLKGPCFTANILGNRLTFLIGPEASAPFFKAGDEQMSQPEVYGFMTPVFGKNVVYDAEPSKRKQQMQHTSTNLKSNKLRAYVPKIQKETEEFLQRWGNEGEVDILKELSDLTILTASRCLHGDDVREDLFEDVARLYNDLDKGITPLSFFFPYAPTEAHRKRDAARKEMVRIFSKVIAQRRAKASSSDDTTDILQVYIDLKYKDGSTLTDDEIVGLLIALLFAGQHTSSITSTWTTMFLLHNKHCLEKAIQEQGQVLQGNSVLDFDLVGNMEYLQNCVKESLRMHPPLIMLMRKAKMDTDVVFEDKKYVIPKGDIVITSPAFSMRLPHVFKDPDQFDPERFSEERGEHKTPFAYLGFGGGIHACLGQQFGLLQVKTIVSILLRNFDLQPVDSEMCEPDYTAMVVGPHNHLRVRYTKKPESTI